MGEKITTKYLLDLVSRSFTLTIPLLDKNKKIKVEVQYLLARIIDTIEERNTDNGIYKYIKNMQHKKFR